MQKARPCFHSGWFCLARIHFVLSVQTALSLPGKPEAVQNLGRPASSGHPSDTVLCLPLVNLVLSIREGPTLLLLASSSWQGLVCLDRMLVASESTLPGCGIMKCFHQGTRCLLRDIFFKEDLCKAWNSDPWEVKSHPFSPPGHSQDGHLHLQGLCKSMTCRTPVSSCCHCTGLLRLLEKDSHWLEVLDPKTQVQLSG